MSSGGSPNRMTLEKNYEKVKIEDSANFNLLTPTKNKFLNNSKKLNSTMVLSNKEGKGKLNAFSNNNSESKERKKINVQEKDYLQNQNKDFDQTFSSKKDCKKMDSTSISLAQNSLELKKYINRTTVDKNELKVKFSNEEKELIKDMKKIHIIFTKAAQIIQFHYRNYKKNFL